MNKDEISQLLSGNLSKRSEPLNPPTAQDWKILKSRFHTEFSEEFVYFAELVGTYYFPGELFDIGEDGYVGGDGTIEMVYEQEVNLPGRRVPWNADLIPFFGDGSGDFFTLSANEGKLSPVYYVYHEDGHYEKYAESFAGWLTGLPELLGD